jgi:hypothetical protein
MGDQTHADMFEWEPIHEEPYQMFAQAFYDKETVTFGNTTTEWITSDTTMEIRE